MLSKDPIRKNLKGKKQSIPTTTERAKSNIKDQPI